MGFCGMLRTPDVAFLTRGKDDVDHQKAPTNGLTQTLQSLGAPDMAPGSLCGGKRCLLAQLCQHWVFSHNPHFSKGPVRWLSKGLTTQSDIPEFPPQDAQR